MLVIKSTIRYSQRMERVLSVQKYFPRKIILFRICKLEAQGGLLVSIIIKHHWSLSFVWQYYYEFKCWKLHAKSLGISMVDLRGERRLRFFRLLLIPSPHTISLVRL